MICHHCGDDNPTVTNWYGMGYFCEDCAACETRREINNMVKIKALEFDGNENYAVAENAIGLFTVMRESRGNYKAKYKPHVGNGCFSRFWTIDDAKSWCNSLNRDAVFELLKE